MIDLKNIKDIAKDTAQQFGSEWNSALVGGDNGNYHAIICEEKNDLVIATDSDTRENSWLCDYLESVDPKSVISLIDQLEAAEAELARLKAQEPVAYQYYYHNHGTGGGEWTTLPHKQAFETMKTKYDGDGDASFRELYAEPRPSAQHQRFVVTDDFLHTIVITLCTDRSISEKIKDLRKLLNHGAGGEIAE